MEQGLKLLGGIIAYILVQPLRLFGFLNEDAERSLNDCAEIIIMVLVAIGIFSMSTLVAASLWW